MPGPETIDEDEDRRPDRCRRPCVVEGKFERLIGDAGNDTLLAVALHLGVRMHAHVGVNHTSS